MAAVLFQVAANQPGAAEYKAFWAKKDAEFRNASSSPLKPQDLARFDSIPRYAFNPAFRVSARWEKVSGATPFGMKTTTSQLAEYKLAGYLHFTIEGKSLKLPAYNSVKHANHPLYKDRLFILFTDQTNGKTTYMGGRYIDMPGITGPTTTLDFNQAYNPYCVYNEKYSCPIPPAECNLPVQIAAGARVKK